MRINPIPLIAVLLLPCMLMAQINHQPPLYLKSGLLYPEKNITPGQLSQLFDNASRSAGKSFAILQFKKIPGIAERQILAQQGIELLDYIPDNAFTISFSGSPGADILNLVQARAFISLSPSQKMTTELAAGIIPSRSNKVKGFADVWISFPRSFSYQEVIQELQQKNFQILDNAYRAYRIIALRVPAHRLFELAGLPCIEYVQPVPPANVMLNYNSIYASKANMLKAPLAYGGRNLDGSGVTLGIGDDGDPQTHVDFTNRLINRVGYIPRNHATHVTGTAGGAGIRNELYTGYAPKATLLTQVDALIIENAATYVQDHGMVISNNSYGSVTDDCDYNGLYDLTARILDQQAYDLPELNYVFAAGNNGAQTCAPYSTGFKNVLGGYQSAKNVITTGSTDFKSDLSGFSSKGPVRDGRLKPEIMSQGEFVASTWTNNVYSYNNGTSMAAPGVSGALALLIQRYRQLNSGNNPKSGLMKALLCNGGNDRGNAGPDYSYGFGQMNLIRTLAMLEGNTSFNTTITQGNTNTETIAVPANTAQLKVLLYWHDPPAAVMASKTLVNDLDLQVVNPSSTVLLPAKLDTIAANVNNTATTGADHINNIEQIVINNPAAGNYDLRVIGTTIAQNPSQEYFLVYDIIPESLVLTNPVGGERLLPTTSTLDTFYIQWDDYESSVNTYTLEFSSNNGSSWSTLSNTIPSTSRLYKWGVPNTPTDVGRIRITKNSTAFTQTSFPFVITTAPTVSLASVQCEGYITINWTAVSGATDYEVMWLQGDEMVSRATTTSLTYTFSGLSKDSLYWVTVRPRINGNPGRRALAVSRQPNSGTCAGTISDNDIKADSIISPATGRLNTSTALSNAVPVTVRIKNLDNATSSGDITVSYSINGGAAVTEVITSPTADIAAGSTIDHTFSTTADLSAAGSYNIVVYAKKGSDPVALNDTLRKQVKQLTNDPIITTDLPWTDNMESVDEQTVIADQMGLSGSDRYDFVNSTIYGRLRSFINTGIAYSGDKALTLDMTRYQLAGNVDSLTGTFNLATFNAATDDIRMDFRYKNHGQESDPANKVWIRGSDTDNWIEMYNLFANQNDPDGSYKLSVSLEVADSLNAHSQNFSSSFQMRFGQWGQYMTADDISGAGYSFDDIRIYRAVDDIQMVSIDTPTAEVCNLNSTVPVMVTVRNTTGSTVNNVPVVLRVDGSVVATETIPTIAGNSTAQYTFSPGVADLSAPGTHTVEAWVDYSTDNVRQNDTALVTVNNLPLISSFPYLQDFETDEGNWYTTAKTYSTWEYGTPISAKINRAASGSKAWKTNIDGYYNSNELSYLYSPCFDLSSMTNPTLSFSLALDIEDCGGILCDAAWVEYSDNGGLSWNKLGSMGNGTNWYNKNYAGEQLWSQQDYTRWHVASTGLPTTNNSSIRFRFVFDSDEGLSKDGIAVDDIHIFDNINPIYETTGTSPVVNQSSVTGSNWIDFIESGSGEIIASINPNGQNLGSTDVQSYINTAAVRINSDQYYHDRNITIKPTTVNLADSATVRFYFLDSETETLIAATGCSYCFKPSMAYELGVTKYSDADDNVENGTLADNTPGNYIFINAANVKMVPYDKGYYAEFKVKDFSEFWLNNGGFDNNTPLPATLVSFTATKTNNGKDALVEWRTATETNVHHYEVEVALGNNGLQQNQFIRIGEVTAVGNSTVEQYYRFTDIEANKTGVRYYRLKIVDIDGQSKYSAIRPVVFSSEINWQVNPNPSADGHFRITLQADQGKLVQFRVMDANGRLIKQKQAVASGFVQKQDIDLSAMSKGMYLLEATVGESRQLFRLVRQ